MRVLLIAANTANTPYPVYPLGVCMVAEAVRRAGHDVHLIDYLAEGCVPEAIASFLDEVKPDIVGLSIRNIDNVNFLNQVDYIEAVKDIMRVVRSRTNAPVVLGGSGFSLLPEIILQEVSADYGIVGEGESLMVEFLDGAARGEFPSNRCITTDRRMAGEDIPSASYDSTLLDYYLKSGNIASVQTKRGCTHRCVYCSYPTLEGDRLRCRNPEAVVDDIETLVYDHKAQYVFFTDSLFNDDQQTYLDVVRTMKRRGVLVPWTAFFKPQGLSDDLMELMRETGLRAAEIGSDASTDVTLRRLGKSFRFKDIVECNDMFRRHEIVTAHYYMFGSPGETEQTVQEGIENILRMTNTVSFVFMGIRLLPGTVLAKIAEREGIIRAGDNLLNPFYYVAPGIDKDWLEKTLTDAFAGASHCVFPPDSMDESLRFLHKLGYSGSLWDMLLPKTEGRRGLRRNGGR